MLTRDYLSCNFPQSNGEAQWINDGELCLESVIYPRWDGCTRGSSFRGSERLQRSRTSPCWLSGFGCASQSAVRHPAARAGTHAVRRSNHWQGGRHHTKYHQTDPLKVRTRRSGFKLNLEDLIVEHLVNLTNFGRIYTTGSTSIGKKMQAQQKNPLRFTPPLTVVQTPAEPSWISCRRKQLTQSCEFSWKTPEKLTRVLWLSFTCLILYLFKNQMAGGCILKKLI